MSEKLKSKRLDIYPGDVKKISGCSTSTAHRRIEQCRDAIGKREHEILTIKEFSNYYGYEYQEVLIILDLVQRS